MNAVVNHVTLCVLDAARAERFYVEVLGFDLEGRVEVPDDATIPLMGVAPPVGLEVSTLRNDTFVLKLLHFERPDNPLGSPRVLNEPGLALLSMAVEDMTTALTRTVELGGSVVHAGGYAAMVRDPDGQILELLPMSYRTLDGHRRQG